MIFMERRDAETQGFFFGSLRYAKFQKFGISKCFLFFVICSFFFFISCQNEPHPTSSTSSIPTTGNPALDGLSKEIAASPNDPRLYAQRGALNYENEGYDEAIRDLNKALSYDSTNVTYLHLLADAYLDYYQSYNAISTMKKAATLYPKRIPTLLKLCEFQLILQQYDESINTINNILKIQPLNAEAFFMLGMNFKEMGNVDRAIGSFQTAVENDPDLIDAWINLGQLHSQKKSKLTPVFFDNALKIDPNNVSALHAKAEYLHHSDQLPAAIATYRQLNIIDPTYEEGFFNSGIIYLEMDSLKQAYNHFNLAVQTSPTYILAYYYRGLVQEKVGNVAAAKKDYQQALNLNPEFERASVALAELTD